jgi:hypothetical protein
MKYVNSCRNHGFYVTILVFASAARLARVNFMAGVAGRLFRHFSDPSSESLPKHIRRLMS